MIGDTEAKGGRACLPTITSNSSPPSPSTAVPKLTVANPMTDSPPTSFLAQDKESVVEPIAKDRNGYWFPMLLLGFLILLAPLVYQPSVSAGADVVWNPVNSATHVPGIAFAPLQTFATADDPATDPMFVALYWFCVAMFGPLISLLWYHRRARRRGVTPQTGWHLLYACTTLALYVVLFPVIEFIALSTRPNATRPAGGHLDVVYFLTIGTFVLGLVIAATAVMPARSGLAMPVRRWTVAGFGVLLAVAAAAAIEFTAYMQPRDGYGSLLIIGMGLLALSLVERGSMCVAVAVAFTAAALLANTVGLHAVLVWLGFQVQQPWSAVATAFANLLLPGAILVLGSVVGIARVAAGRFARQPRPM